MYRKLGTGEMFYVEMLQKTNFDGDIFMFVRLVSTSHTDAIRQFWWPHVHLFRQFGAERNATGFNSIVLSVCLAARPSIHPFICLVGVTLNEMSFSRIAVWIIFFWFRTYGHIRYTGTSKFIPRRQIEAAHWVCVCVSYFSRCILFAFKWKMKNEMNSHFIEAQFLQLNHLFKAKNSKFVCALPRNNSGSRSRSSSKK